jgi:lambda repressor-like predicted transcriptional regulator
MGKKQKKGVSEMAGWPPVERPPSVARSTLARPWPPQEIRAALMLRGVKQKDIAKEVGVDASMISLVIKCERVSRRVRKAIAQALGREVVEIWPAA